MMLLGTAYSIFYIYFDLYVTVVLTVFFFLDVLYAYYALIWYCKLEVCRQVSQVGSLVPHLIA